MENEEKNSQELVVDDKSLEEYKDDPLGLLVHLISEAKENIFTVKLSQFTEKFIEYIKETKDIDLEKASQFIDIASTLLEIKAKNMLPKEVEEAPVDEMDPEEALRRRLILYTMFKDASVELGYMEKLGHYYKEPEKSANDYRIILTNFNLDAMLDSFAKILIKVEKAEEIKEPKKILKDRFTVAEKMTNIKTTIKEKKRTTFSSLFEDTYTRGEVITVFLALLELLKRQAVFATQNDLFDEIIIDENENYKEIQEDIVTEFDEQTDNDNMVGE